MKNKIHKSLLVVLATAFAVMALSSCENLFTETMLKDTADVSFSIVTPEGEPLPVGTRILTTLSGTEHSLLELHNEGAAWKVVNDGLLHVNGNIGFVGGVAVLPDGSRMFCESGSYGVTAGKVHVKMVFVR